EDRLAALGAALLLETLRALAEGSARPVPQDAARATLAPLIRKEDGRLDWLLEAEALARRVRGFHPWPGAFTVFQGRDLKVLRAGAEPGGDPTGSDAPGTVVHVDR